MVFLLSFFCLGARAGTDIPPYTQPLEDQAHLLTGPQVRQIETQLRDMRTRLGVQAAALSVPSLGDEELETFALRVAEKWQLGARGLDDGLLIVVDAQTHRMRIEVGYGLEAFLPDAVASQILRAVPSNSATQNADRLDDGERLVFVVAKISEVLASQSEEIKAQREALVAREKLGPAEQQLLLLLKIGTGLALVLWLTLGARYMAKVPHRPLDQDGRPASQQSFSGSRFFAALLDVLFILPWISGGRGRDSRNDRGGGGRFGGGGASGS